MVNHNDYLGRGEDYVNNLAHGVSRHLTLSYRLTIIEEDTVPSGVEGWWSKLAMFEPGRFRGRCLYFDLDTVICGSLNDIASYQGDFAGIDDFFSPHMLASGVMTWDADKDGPADIWLRWEASGRPMIGTRGDGGWIDSVCPAADRLQKHYPGQIVSFKRDCMEGIPDEARVVCFHGVPRPHTIAEVAQHWS